MILKVSVGCLVYTCSNTCCFWFLDSSPTDIPFVQHLSSMVESLDRSEFFLVVLVFVYNCSLLG